MQIPSFISSIIPNKELGELLAENLKPIRLERQIKNLQRVKKICDANNIPLKNVDLKVMFPYLQNIGLEEDAVLQEMWANLIANYIDETKNLELVVYPEILKQLSSKEVQIIKCAIKGRVTSHFYPKDKTPEALKHSEYHFHIDLISNLVRLGILKQESKIDVVNKHYLFGTPPKSESFKPKEVNEFQITAFGKSFYEACTR